MPELSLTQSAAASLVKVVDLVDPVGVSEDFEALDQQVLHLDTGLFRARRVTLELVSCMLVSHHVQAHMRSRTAINKDLMSFTVFSPKADGTVDGIAVSRDLLVIGAPSAVAEIVAEPAYRSITIMMSPARLADHLVRKGSAVVDPWPPSGVEFRRPAREGAQRLFEFGRKLISRAVRHPEVFDDHQGARTGADIELIETLLGVVGSSDPFEPTRKDQTRKYYRQIVELAEARALADPSARLYVADLCEAAGVSERTLETAFQRTLGIAPMGFLKRARLHGARRDLQEGSRASVTVSTVALDWGFWHFGDFSKSYKACFGETPSETLRRPCSILLGDSSDPVGIVGVPAGP